MNPTTEIPTAGEFEFVTIRSSDPLTIDRWGTLTSALCAVHCLGFAFLPGVISALGLGVLFAPAFEWALAALALLLASIASLSGWRRHRTRSVALAFIIGGTSLISSRLLEEMGVEGWGLPTAIIGAGALVTGHVLNTRYVRRHKSG